VRLVLGAQPLTVGTIALCEALAFSVPAIIVGTIGGYAGALLLRSQLYDVAPGDPVTYACAIGALCVAAGTAAFVPAVRVAQTDPCMTLRNSSD
jgi:putative ABC transport system permease protein